MEAFSPVFKQAQDFLVTIAEPITRPRHMHEYKLTEYSLYAAVSVGLDTDCIVDGLQKFSKTDIPEKVLDFINIHTKSYGKANLVLKSNRFWIEGDENVIETLMSNNLIKQAVLQESRVVPVEMEPFKIPYKPNLNEIEKIDLFDLFEDTDFPEYTAQDYELMEKQVQAEQDKLIESQLEVEQDKLTEKQLEAEQERSGEINSNTFEMQTEFQSPIELDMDNQNDTQRLSFEIKKEMVEEVKKQCSDLKLPLLEEYDFHIDCINPKLNIDLKPKTKLRPYQEQSLGKMFGNGRARSGVIVLPCGAGKTLVGITAACTIKKSCLILCTSTVSVSQWAREFKYWSTISPDQIATFSSETKQKFNSDAGILITTYTMVTFPGKRAYDAEQMMAFIQAREWGLILLDEVHVVPADMFKKVLTKVSAHCKLGLTATLLREDSKIDNLNYLVGPKLYLKVDNRFEANWSQLAESGHIARVQCAEVRCQMSTPFFREYLKEPSRKRQLLYTMNPRKIQTCQYLILFHESLGHKILVYSDNVFTLKVIYTDLLNYAGKLNRPYIYGGTSQGERIRVLQQFRFNPALNTLFISKVGDTSIDLPEANVLIQISSQYGSRRQEAQRLGRILRKKRKNTVGFDAFFYTLVSTDTEEMFYALKRQQFLVDQGYEFKIITNIADLDSTPNLVYTNIKQELELLNTVLIANLKEDDEEEEENQDEELACYSKPIVPIVRTFSSLATISGGNSMAYLEYNRGTTSGLKKIKLGNE